MSEAVLESPPENLEEEAESPIVRFQAINDARIERVQASLSRRKSAFLEALDRKGVEEGQGVVGGGGRGGGRESRRE